MVEIYQKQIKKCQKSYYVGNNYNERHGSCPLRLESFNSHILSSYTYPCQYADNPELKECVNAFAARDAILEPGIAKMFER